MKKNKFVMVSTSILSICFLFFIFYMTRDLSKIEESIVDSPNVVDITDDIQTSLLVRKVEFSEPNWAELLFDDNSWDSVSIPKHKIVSESEYQENSYAYYRVFIPLKSFKDLSGLENEVYVSLQYIRFKKFDIYINGKFFRTIRPSKAIEYITNIPVEDGKDNLVGIKGYISSGDVGINHRGRILLGKAGELNEIYGKSYKLITVMGLIFILCKGCVLLIFSMMFLVLKVDRFFERSICFAVFVLLEDIVISDYVSKVLNFNQQLLIYNLINIAINSFFFLFLSDVLNLKINKKHQKWLVFCLCVISFAIAIDVLYLGYNFNTDSFLKFWNLVFISNILVFMPVLLRKERIFFLICFVALLMTSWSTFFSGNVGHNLKAYGNLLIFFGVAYQTFLLFKREQLQLFEQEKDVAIGKTAAILAHDVRRPLEQMSIMLDQIGNTSFTEEDLKVAKKDIEFSINSVTGQINDIMNFNRSEVLEFQSSSFYLLLYGSLKQLLFIKQHLDIQVEYHFRADKMVSVDAARLSNVLCNLIENALEAIEIIGKQKTGKISFSTRLEGGRFHFSIFNSGPTIPDDILEKIFNPLFTSSKPKGTGLGLASAQKIVKDHGSIMSVKNIDSQGVEFKFDLPVLLQSDSWEKYGFNTLQKKTSVSEKELPSDLKTRHLRVVVFDNDNYSFSYIREVLQSLSSELEISYVNNVDEGIKLITSKRFDLYLINSLFDDTVTGEFLYENYLYFLNNEVMIYSQENPLSIDKMKRQLVQLYNSRKKILLIEDSKIIAIAWLVFHGKHNLNVIDKPEDALVYLKDFSGTIDCVVLDNFFDNSPMRGSELAGIIKSLYPDLKIFMASADKSMQSGEIDKIEKSFYDVRKLKR